MNQETVVACIQSLVSSRNELQTSVDNLTTEKTSLTEQVTNLNAEVANLKEMAQVGKNHIASLRQNAVATYKKLMGDKADETIVTMSTWSSSIITGKPKTAPASSSPIAASLRSVKHSPNRR